METEDLREMRKLTGKETWFRKLPKNKDQRGGGKEQGRRGRRRMEKEGLGDRRQPATIIFVRRSPEGALASALRRKEEEINKTLKKKVKVIERNGPQLQRLLVRSDPWSGGDCGRTDCVVCQVEGDNRVDCRVTNCTYRTSCKLCEQEGSRSSYIGETSRSVKERMGEHAGDARKDDEGSHIAAHLRERHHREWTELGEEKEGWNHFKVEVLKTHTTSFRRQLHEAVMIAT